MTPTTHDELTAAMKSRKTIRTPPESALGTTLIRGVRGRENPTSPTCRMEGVDSRAKTRSVRHAKQDRACPDLRLSPGPPARVPVRLPRRRQRSGELRRHLPDPGGRRSKGLLDLCGRRSLLRHDVDPAALQLFEPAGELDEGGERRRPRRAAGVRV